MELAAAAEVGWAGIVDQLEGHPACTQLKMELGGEKATGYHMLQSARQTVVGKLERLSLIKD